MSDPIYQSSPVGHHITCTFVEVPIELLVDHTRVLEVIKKHLLRDRYCIENIAVKYFSKTKRKKRKDGKSAYTLVLTLSESHITVHGYLEFRTFAFDFYTCRGRNAGQPIFESIAEELDLSFHDFCSMDRTVKF